MTPVRVLAARPRSSATSLAAHRQTVAAIRARCLERGWDLRELARRASVSRTTLHHLLSGVTRRPHIATVSRLAAALGLDAGELARAAVHPPRERPALSPIHASHAGADFDRHTNPAVTEASRARPELFAGWTTQEWDELYSTFGVGGNLSAEGVTACADAINDRRETTRKLHLVLETHLADVARNLVETLYGMIRPHNDATPPDVVAAAAADPSARSAAAAESPSDPRPQ